MNETKILEIIASHIESNPESKLKDRIDEVFRLNEPISFSTAVDIINSIRVTLGLAYDPLPVDQFCKSFAENFNNAIKVKMADVFIKTPIFYETKLIEALNKIFEDIGFEKYCIIKKYLKSKDIELIDIKNIINKANYRLKSF